MDGFWLDRKEEYSLVPHILAPHVTRVWSIRREGEKDDLHVIAGGRFSWKLEFFRICCNTGRELRLKDEKYRI